MVPSDASIAFCRTGCTTMPASSSERSFSKRAASATCAAGPLLPAEPGIGRIRSDVIRPKRDVHRRSAVVYDTNALGAAL